MNEWLPPIPDLEEQASVRKALHNKVQKAAGTFVSGKGREFLQRMSHEDLNCRLFNDDDSNRNPYGVVAGGTDLSDALEVEAQNSEHAFSVRMSYTNTKRLFLTDIAVGGIQERIEFETRFVHQLINELRPDVLRKSVANILVNSYLGIVFQQEIDMEDLETSTRPSWREGEDVAWLMYEREKLRQVYEQLCSGTFVSTYELSQ